MRTSDVLDRVLNGEPVEATEDVLHLAGLAHEVQAVFSAVEPTPFDSGTGLNRALEALRESSPRRVTPSLARRVAAGVLVAAAMLLALPTAAWAASDAALPGELLYPVKRAFEQVRLMIASTPVDEAAVLLDQAAERLDEAARARALGLTESAKAAEGGYAEAMAWFDRRIEEARRQGLDVSRELAIAGDLIERHDALLDALGTGAISEAPAEEMASDPPPADSSGAQDEGEVPSGDGGEEAAAADDPTDEVVEVGSGGDEIAAPVEDDGAEEDVEGDPTEEAASGEGASGETTTDPGVSDETTSEETADESTPEEDADDGASEETTSDESPSDESPSDESPSDERASEDDPQVEDDASTAA